MRSGLALGLAVLATAGCASNAVTGPQSGAHAAMGLVIDSHAGAPEGVAPQTAPDGRLAPMAARIGDDSRLRITIWGSSSCPSVIDRALINVAGNKITLILREDSEGPCTADIAPTTSVIRFPASVHINRPVRVVTQRPGVNETWVIDV